VAATPNTPTVFCAVSAVMTVAPKTPFAAKDFRSAWIPAPPPESDPAIVSATGGPRRSAHRPLDEASALAISAPYRRHYPDQVPRVVDRVADLSARFRRAPLVALVHHRSH